MELSNMGHEKIPTVIAAVAAVALVVTLLPKLFAPRNSGETEYRPTLAAGIPPVAELVQTIAGDEFQVITLLPEGKSPHDYNPEAKNIRLLSLADLFFHCALPVEKKAASLIIEKNRCIDISENIRFLDCEDNHDHEHHHHAENRDPHIWLNVDNLIIIGENIRDAMSARYPELQSTFVANFAKLRDQLLKDKEQMLTLTSGSRGKKLFVYHPAFGYFAEMVGMKQFAVELEGREPSPRQLGQVIKSMQNENARIFFAQSGFSPLAASAISRQTGAKVVEVDVLSRDIIKTMTDICQAIKDYE